MNKSDLDNLRDEIDEVDSKIIFYIKKRADLGRRVALVKDKLDLPETDSGREEKQIEWINSQVKNEIILKCLHDVFLRLRTMSKEIRKIRK